jgi:hypothetical protein
MSTPHRATEEQWEIVEICREQKGHTTHGLTATCLLELRSRVELLERRCEVQLQQLGDLQDRHHRLAGSVRLLEREVVRDQPEPAPPATDQDLYQLYDLTGPTVVDAFRAIYDLGRQHGARAAATEADNATAATVAEIRSSLFKDAAQPAPSALAESVSVLDAKAWAYIGRQAILGDPDAQSLVDLLSDAPAAQLDPPSLKQEAWKLLEDYGTNGVRLTHEQCSTIRRALEALPDD